MRSDWGLGPHIYAGHYALLHYILVKFHPSGTAVEFGMGTGESLDLIARHMPVIGFGSKDGLPEDWREEYPKGSFACETPDVPGAVIVEGLFEDTLPTFDFPDDISLAHFDADLYSSTATALKYVGPHIKPGCIVIFDEWFGFDGCEQYEQRAFKEFMEATGNGWETIGHAREAWAVRIV